MSTAPELLARLQRYVATVELEDNSPVVRGYGDLPIPRELLEECRVHKRELLEWLKWERHADTLWRAVHRRIAATGPRDDLATDPKYLQLEARADAAHLRHDRAALVDALTELEAHAMRAKDGDT